MSYRLHYSPDQLAHSNSSYVATGSGMGMISRNNSLPSISTALPSLNTTPLPPIDTLSYFAYRYNTTDPFPSSPRHVNPMPSSPTSLLLSTPSSSGEDNRAAPVPERPTQKPVPVALSTPAQTPTRSTQTFGQKVCFDTESLAFHHPATKPPKPLPVGISELEKVLAELRKNGSPPPKAMSKYSRRIRKTNSSKYKTGISEGLPAATTNGLGQFKITTAQKRITKKTRKTPHEKGQGRPFGCQSVLTFKLVSDVAQLYRCASHGKDAASSVMAEAVIYTDDLSQSSPSGVMRMRQYSPQTTNRKRRNLRSRSPVTAGDSRPFHANPCDESSIPLFEWREVLDTDIDSDEESEVAQHQINCAKPSKFKWVKVYHYTKIGEAMEHSFGDFGITKDNFTYYEVIRASSSLKSLARNLTGNKKVMKIIARPIPDDSIHDIVHVKASICYPRYKKNMTLFISPGSTFIPYAYYASDTLWDQEELLGFDRADGVYCGPSLLGIQEVTPYEDRISARKLLLSSREIELEALKAANQRFVGGDCGGSSGSGSSSGDDIDDCHKYSKAPSIKVAENREFYRQQVLEFQGIKIEDYISGFPTSAQCTRAAIDGYSGIVKQEELAIKQEPKDSLPSRSTRSGTGSNPGSESGSDSDEIAVHGLMALMNPKKSESN